MRTAFQSSRQRFNPKALAARSIWSVSSGLSLLAFIAFLPIKAHAWADRGHEIVGQIAEENLKPETRNWVRGVLGLEPLGVAAIFPDHVKDDQRFAHYESDPAKRESDIHDFGEFHYCEIPVGETYANRKRKIVKDCFGAIEGAIEILKSRGQSQKQRIEKQIALRYLTHVMGDIGNPLHVGNGADRGGNLCRVRWDIGGQAKEANLHAVWDDLLIQHLGQMYADSATNRKPALYMGDYLKVIREKYKDDFTPAGKKKYGAGSTAAWLEESAALRETGIYPDSADEMKDIAKGQEPFHRSYCETESAPGITVKSEKPLKPATLDRAYADKFAVVAELQLVKAGLRLAAVLDSIAAAAKKTKAPTLTDTEQDAILESVQTKFKNKTAN